MGLERFADYLPSAWMHEGVLFMQNATDRTREVAEAVVKNAGALIAVSAVAAASCVVFSAATATSWPPTPQQRQHAQALEAVSEIYSRIDQKLANFLKPDASIDTSLLAEARRTLDAVVKNKKV